MKRAALAALALAGCVPSFDEEPGLVDRPRVLAIRAEPAEAAPGETVRLEALAVAPDGPSPGAVAWALCLLPRPLAADAPVDPACVEGEGPGVSPLGSAEAATPVVATLPPDACARFGPEPPAPEPGAPALRPVDPDPTGGYHQPVRARLEGADPAVGRVRLRCALPHVPVALAAELRAQPPNRSPSLTLAVTASDAALELAATIGADADEPYLRYDAAAVGLAAGRESLTVSWFSTAGSPSPAVEGATAGGVARATLEVPAGAGTVHVWAVLRDDRGGVAWAHQAIER